MELSPLPTLQPSEDVELPQTHLSLAGLGLESYLISPINETCSTEHSLLLFNLFFPLLPPAPVKHVLTPFPILSLHGSSASSWKEQLGLFAARPRQGEVGDNSKDRTELTVPLLHPGEPQQQQQRDPEHFVPGTDHLEDRDAARSLAQAITPLQPPVQQKHKMCPPQREKLNQYFLLQSFLLSLRQRRTRKTG